MENDYIAVKAVYAMLIGDKTEVNAIKEKYAERMRQVIETRSKIDGLKAAYEKAKAELTEINGGINAVG